MTTLPSLDLPIPTLRLAEWLPHRPPMVWVDEVMAFDQKSGEARVRLAEGAHYMDEKGLRPASLIELIAQSFGYVHVCQKLEQAKAGKLSPPVTKAFLCGVRDARFAESLQNSPPRAGRTLIIRVGNIKTFGPIQSIDGQVHDADSGEELASANLKVFSE